MTMCSRAPRLARGCALPNNHSAVYVTRPAQTRPAGYAIAQPTPRGSIAGQARLHLQPRKASRPACCMSLGSEELRAPPPAARRSRAAGVGARSSSLTKDMQHAGRDAFLGWRWRRAWPAIDPRGVGDGVAGGPSLRWPRYIDCRMVVRQGTTTSGTRGATTHLSLIHISEPTRLGII